MSSVLPLDDPSCLDPAVAGAKAAWLARARAAGLPVLDGIVVTADVSRRPMAIGAAVMETRGSGGARMALTTEDLPAGLSEELAAAVSPLGEPMVVRSSSILEAGGEWSGAFTSYLEIDRPEVDVAVRGCWASAFTVHTLDRYRSAGLAPGSVPMAVLVQPALEPDFGGTARLESTGDVVVVGIAGSPAPLVQGWDPGSHARIAPNGAVGGVDAIGLMGEELLGQVAGTLLRAHEAVGATSCEWAARAGEVTLFQLMRTPERLHRSPALPTGIDDREAVRLARLIRRAPGPLGESLVLPWAVADPERHLDPVEAAAVDASEALQEATEHARELTAEVWGMPKPAASARAQEVLRALRSSEPGPALSAIRRLRPPDPERARLVLALVGRVRAALVEAGAVSTADAAWHIAPERAAPILEGRAPGRLVTRIGFDRWEPFDLAVVLGRGRPAAGTAAAPGMASGRLCFIANPAETSHFRPRDVVVGTHPVPNLAALLWDAAALVTTGGGPAAHLFESARALAIPAVCSVHLDEALGVRLAEASGRFAMAVDGDTGQVSVTRW